MSGQPLLAVENLTVEYATAAGPIRAVSEASFTVSAGQALGIVGESGCGKSTIANSLLRLLPANGQITGGRINLDGQDLATLPEPELRRIRGNQVAMVFQAAMNSLNPVYRVGDQIVEAMEQHLDLPRPAMIARVEDLYDLVGLERSAIWRYPHQYSGGMKQRAIIAMALSCDPALLVADEPTTALDVIVQDQILGKLQQIRQQRSTAMILISHDLGVIARVCDHLAIMYAGQVIEFGPTGQVLANPIHRYSQALIASIPNLHGPKNELSLVAGEPPDLLAAPPGCRFHPRCAHLTDDCPVRPAPAVVRGPHWALCWNPAN